MKRWWSSPQIDFRLPWLSSFVAFANPCSLPTGAEQCAVCLALSVKPGWYFYPSHSFCNNHIGTSLATKINSKQNCAHRCAFGKKQASLIQPSIYVAFSFNCNILAFQSISRGLLQSQQFWGSVIFFLSLLANPTWWKTSGLVVYHPNKHFPFIWLVKVLGVCLIYLAVKENQECKYQG